jgi:hypothetical protein
VTLRKSWRKLHLDGWRMTWMRMNPNHKETYVRQKVKTVIVGLKRGGPCAETRFRLSEKRTSPFE